MARLCPDCPTVPVVSQRLADVVTKRLPVSRQAAVLIAAMAWLVERHVGLTLYEGINGRPYTDTEKDAIGAETGLVAGLPCPFVSEKGCTLGGLGAGYSIIKDSGRPPYAWLPVWITRAYALADYRILVRHRNIADAKVALLTRNSVFYTKEDAGKIMPAEADRIQTTGLGNIAWV